MAGPSFQQLLEQRRGRIRRARGVDLSQLFRTPVQPAAPTFLTPQTAQTQIESQLQQAGVEEPEAEGGVDVLGALFNILDIPGAAVRGGIGAVSSLFKGDLEEAGERALSVLPAAGAFLGPLGIGAGVAAGALGLGEAPTGEELISEIFGTEPGTTTEDERRVRIAKVAGLGDTEARQLFETRGEDLGAESAAQFDQILQQALQNNPELDIGANFDDTANATDVGDFAGVAAEILLDPLTYLSFGATAAGKAARGLKAAEQAAPGLLKILGKVEKAEDVAKAVITHMKGIAGQTEKSIARHSKFAEALFDAGARGEEAFKLGETVAERARLGQTVVAALPEFLGGKPLIRGEKFFKMTSAMADMPVFTKLRRVFGGPTDRADLNRMVDARDTAAKLGRIEIEATTRGFSSEVARIAEANNVTLERALQLVGERVELGDAMSKADIAFLKDTGLEDVARGLVTMNESFLSKAQQLDLQITRLKDPKVNYLHRQLSPEARKWVKRNKAQFKKKSGLSLIRSDLDVAVGRNKLFEGKTLAEANEIARKKFDGVDFDFFNTNPIEATREAAFEGAFKFANARMAHDIVNSGIKLFEDVGPGGIDELVALGKLKAPKLSIEDLKSGEFDVTKQLFPDELRKNYVSGADLFREAKLKTDHLTDEDFLKLAGTAIDRELFDTVMRGTSIFQKPEAIGGFFRKFNQWMKTLVTIPFFSYHGRNLTENATKFFTEAGPDMASIKEAGQLILALPELRGGLSANLSKKIVSKSESDAIKKLAAIAREMQISKSADDFSAARDLARLMLADNTLGGRTAAEFGDIFTPIGAQATRKGIRGLPKKALDAGFKVADANENLFRMAYWLNRVKKGHSLSEAREEVFRVYFDLSRMSEFERKHKDLLYFYTWYRSNSRYIAQSLINHPKLSKEAVRMIQSDPDNPNERYADRQASFNVAGQKVTLGFVPQSQFRVLDLEGEGIFDMISHKLAQGVSALAPAVRVPLETAFQKQVFQGRDIEGRVRADAAYSWAPVWLRDKLGVEIETLPDGTERETVDAQTRFLFSTIPAVGRLFQTSTYVLDEDREWIERMLQFTSGIRIKDREPDRNAFTVARRSIENAVRKSDVLHRTKFGVNFKRTKKGQVASTIRKFVTKRARTEDEEFLRQNDPEAHLILSPYIARDADGRMINWQGAASAADRLFAERYNLEKAVLESQRMIQAARDTQTQLGQILNTANSLP